MGSILLLAGITFTAVLTAQAVRRENYTEAVEVLLMGSLLVLAYTLVVVTP